jgi:hypothetical protein
VIVAYYNGVRMRGQESLERLEEETGYAIFVEVNLRKDKNAEHMDVLPEVTNTAFIIRPYSNLSVMSF